MPRKSPYTITLSPREREELERRERTYSLPYYVVVRAKMILMAARGLDNQAIAERLDSHREVVSRWRRQFCRRGLEGIEDSPRSGRPRLKPRPAESAATSPRLTLPCRRKT